MPRLGDVIDHTGQRFGRLVVVRVAGKRKAETVWLCQCDCGKQKEICGVNLRGGTQSCGCLQREGVSRRMKKHGGSKSPTYKIWVGIIDRCENENNRSYPDYGGRGIKMCQRWRESYEAFVADMGERPPKMTIERNDVNGNYEPSNCRWASKKEQANNTTRNHFVEFDGQRLTIAQWAEKIGVKPMILVQRLFLGWSVERALTQPVRHRSANKSRSTEASDSAR